MLHATNGVRSCYGTFWGRVTFLVWQGAIAVAVQPTAQRTCTSMPSSSMGFTTFSATIARTVSPHTYSSLSHCRCRPVAADQPAPIAVCGKEWGAAAGSGSGGGGLGGTWASCCTMERLRLAQGAAASLPRLRHLLGLGCGTLHTHQLSGTSAWCTGGCKRCCWMCAAGSSV